MKTLYLEKRGLNFLEGDPLNELSDIGNYRVGAYNDSIKGKDGNNYSIEFLSFTLIDKKILKNKNALAVKGQFTAKDGITYCMSSSLTEQLEKNKSYTQAHILKAVNELSIEQYDVIEFI